MNKLAFKNHIKHNIYILKVSPKFSAEKPISAGPNINPEKPIVIKFETETLRVSWLALTPSRKTIPRKLAVPKPKINIPGIINFKSKVVIAMAKINEDKIAK